MKLKHTQARKANRGPNITSSWPYGLSVFDRRIQGLLGADHKTFSEKHKHLDGAVEGYKSIRNAKRSVGPRSNA